MRIEMWKKTKKKFKKSQIADYQYLFYSDRPLNGTGTELF